MDSQQSSTEMGIHGGKRAWVWDAAAAAVLITAGVALRLVFRDIPNFAPVAALALFAGYYFRNAGWALLVPLSVMTISDTVLGGYDWPMMMLVYGMLALPVALRGWLRQAFDLRQKSGSQVWAPLAGLFGCGLVSSVLFFVVTNFGVWCCWPGTYERSIAGLWHCYVAAIPFFRFTLAGDLIFAVVLFGSYALALSWERARSLEAEAAC
jgi:hypothetical protein